ncbi:universal stress protein [Bradyrhizobium sp. CB3481]|uniref:universal stress protein n=1 Tax=Bradyrhizobium sp. CB3481 TaxID=3039158 RepID=UPI0024B0B05D|nr:universal stress protein [Bradyrhizobium sp. CB3481]WFU17698.1 universal stress protein [Bradyrhizobium sp. CB3481]
MIKDIVVNLATGSSRDPATAYAISVARMFDAQVAGVAMCYSSVILAAGMEAVPADFVESLREESARVANEAIGRFKQSAAQAGFSAEAQMVETSVEGSQRTFGHIARTFDLAIVAQTDPETTNATGLDAEAAMFESGRPVIVVPSIQKDGIKLGCIVVCWDGSRTAARALADAMPFLQRAKSIEVINVGDGRREAEQSLAAAGRHLARHGLNASTKALVADRTGVANVILSHAADRSADLIVMGGYGHSRLREFILGGVTRGILDTMTVPVLMSH